MSIKRLKSGPRMSQAVVHGNVVYLAGQVAGDPVASVAEQTKQVLAQIDQLLPKLQAWQQRVGDTQALVVPFPKPMALDTSNYRRKPDGWQPRWIVEKYFDATPTP